MIFNEISTAWIMLWQIIQILQRINLFYFLFFNIREYDQDYIISIEKYIQEIEFIIF